MTRNPEYEDPELYELTSGTAQENIVVKDLLDANSQNQVDWTTTSSTNQTIFDRKTMITSWFAGGGRVQRIEVPKRLTQSGMP